MRVILHKNSNESQVVSFYDTILGRIYLILESESDSGLRAVKPRDFQVSDPDLEFFEELTNSDGEKIFVDRDAVANGLLDRMIDFDREAVETFISILKLR